MKAEEKNKVCQCSSTGEVFSVDEKVEVDKYIFGFKVKEKVCPYCGKNHCGLINYRDNHSIEGVYKTEDFFLL
jgi:hypothetical protein